MTSTEMEELKQFNDLAAGFNTANLPSDVNTHGLKGLKAEDIDVGETTGINHFKGKEELLNTEMLNMQELKKKYSSVLSSNDLSTATKRNSLEGKRLTNRLVFGGTFQIHIDQSTSVDVKS